MATLSSFFGSSGGGGAAGIASTFRVFYETGSMTVPSCAVFAAYGVIGGGGICNGCSVPECCRNSGGGGGFSWKEATQTCASDFTVCAIVGGGGCNHPCNCCTVLRQGQASCICGFSGGTICATGGSCWSPGSGSGGDINTSGGRGGFSQSQGMGGGGAGGLLGDGGSPNSSTGGGGYGSGGGGGGGNERSIVCNLHCSVLNARCCCAVFYRGACGGAGGSAGVKGNGGSGLAGTGGIRTFVVQCNATETAAMSEQAPTGGMIPQYTMCGYSQAKTFLSAAGGGGAASGLDGACAKCFYFGQAGAPGGGGGGVSTSTGRPVAGAGGFGAGGGGGSSCCDAPGPAGIGGGAANNNNGNQYLTSGLAGQGIAVVEYWVTTS